MSQPTNVIAQHYGRQQRTAAVILDALAAAGHDLDALAPDVLSGADEFHLGGRLATLAVLEEMMRTAAVQPRERSMQGLARPCTRGPRALAPARRSVIL